MSGPADHDGHVADGEMPPFVAIRDEYGCSLHAPDLIGPTQNSWWPLTDKARLQLIRDLRESTSPEQDADWKRYLEIRQNLRRSIPDADKEVLLVEALDIARRWDIDPLRAQLDDAVALLREVVEWRRFLSRDEQPALDAIDTFLTRIKP